MVRAQHEASLFGSEFVNIDNICKTTLCSSNMVVYPPVEHPVVSFSTKEQILVILGQSFV